MFYRGVGEVVDGVWGMVDCHFVEESAFSLGLWRKMGGLNLKKKIENEEGGVFILFEVETSL